MKIKKLFQSKKVRIIIVCVVILLVSFIVFVFFLASKATAPKHDDNNVQQNETAKSDIDSSSSNQVATQPETKKPTNNQQVIDDPSSTTVVVNKKRPLPSTFTPSDLVTAGIALSGSSGSENMKIRSIINEFLISMVNTAKSKNINLKLLSGYRSYATQKSVYQSYVNSSGQAAADRFSARPGHSEHQTGLSVDLGRLDGKCSLDECFGSTAEGIWLAQNAHSYGFIVRYPQGKESIVGYMYEPWHLRYVGQDLAQKLFTSGKTMEEYFGLLAAPSY